MPLRTIKIDDNPNDVLEDHVHSAATTAADPLTAAYAPKFDALVTGWSDKRAKRVLLVIALGKAKAEAVYLDGQFDDVADLLDNALDKVVKTADDKRREFYLKGQHLSVFKRPVLSKQLAAMALWVGPLATEPEPEMIAVGVALAPLLAPAKLIEDKIALAEQALDAFDNVGEWAQYVEESNALRAAAYGDFLDIPHLNPTLKLPATYAEHFFLHDTSRRGAGKLKSSEELKAQLTALTVKQGQLTKEIADAEAREAAEAKVEADRVAAAAALAALRAKQKEDKLEEKKLEKEAKKKK
jgi:hypothetical protein